MNATKKLFIAAVLLVAASTFTISSLLNAKNGSTGNNPRLILYYGRSCPHCKIVEEFIGKNETVKKMGIVQKEVSQNLENQEEFGKTVRSCNLEPGVPVLWNAAGSKCYQGDQPIIDYLNTLVASPEQ